MIRKKLRYGIDAPFFALGYFILGIIVIVLTLVGTLPNWLFGGLLCTLFGGWMLVSSLFGKSSVLNRVLTKYVPQSTALNALDIGTGRGLVLGKLAHLPNVNHATGIDLWSNKDQSNNDLANTQKNMVLEGIAEKVTLDTGNMLEMPYPDGTFNLITASFSIHNVGKKNVEQVCQEIARVAQPGTTIIIFDIMYIAKYQANLEKLGCQVIKKSLPTPLTFPLATTLVMQK